MGVCDSVKGYRGDGGSRFEFEFFDLKNPQRKKEKLQAQQSVRIASALRTTKALGAVRQRATPWGQRSDSRLALPALRNNPCWLL